MPRFNELDAEGRSALMATIRKTNTKPELIVRKLVHRMGHRFRLHRRDLPGTPDLVFPGRKKVIFVHGCFWHRHNCKAGRKKPSKNVEYWLPKLKRNVERDAKCVKELRSAGWQVLVLWECKVRDSERFAAVLLDFLGRRDSK
ncbi:MAG: DNA mismatch endonuclease Vsr [Steroidobacteraceae bacterium]|nr:DNA mismatch endonuclease Vsr [Steroidobacteraceae bacterium]